MNKICKTFAAGSVLAAALASANAFAGATANIGATSNYLWRGVTQTGDEAAISGGLDYAHDSGLYIGTWTSSLGGNGNYEVDLYAGYAKAFGDAGLDVGVIRYEYPKEGNDTDTTEVYVGGSYKWVSAKVSYADDYFGSGESAYYIEAAAKFEVASELFLGVHAGIADGDAFSDDVADYSLSLSKGEFTLTVSDTNDNEYWGMSDNARIAVSWKKSFDL